LTFWRSFSAAASLAALVLAVLLAAPSPVLPPIVVVLTPVVAAGGEKNTVVPASFVASISGDGRALVMRPLTQVSLASDRALELWSVPRQGAPRSLGLISSDKVTVLQRHQVLKSATALAVSLEPRGGSTTGAPTGPILYVGKLAS
jgi:anti-sigma-K factor RskA